MGKNNTRQSIEGKLHTTRCSRTRNLIALKNLHFRRFQSPWRHLLLHATIMSRSVKLCV